MKAREAAVQILFQIEQEESFAGLALKHKLSAYLEDGREKALATELIYGVIRYKKHLDYVRDCFSKLKPQKLSPWIVQILRISLYQILFLQKIPVSAACNEAVKLAGKYANKGAAGFVNGLLRSVVRNREKIAYPEGKIESLAVKLSFPKEILELWAADFGYEKMVEIAEQSNIPKKASYRVNHLKVPGNFVLSEDLESPENEQAFQDGFVTVQDKGSMLAVERLMPRPEECVLDLCAAPGGKSCYISEKMQNTGRIVACDVYEHRLKLIQQTAERLGASNIETCLNDGTVLRKEWLEQFDKVLADVPCSGLGVLSGKPDIKWRKQDFDKLCELQYNILKNAMQYVKKGGALVYSTCTVHRAENAFVVQKALQDNKNFVLDGEPVQLFPNSAHDGFYVCRLKRCE